MTPTASPMKPHSNYCHKCEWGRIAENVATASPAEIEAARAACADCKGAPEESRMGINLISWDDLPAPDELVQAERARETICSGRRNMHITRLPPDAEDALLELVRIFAALPANEATLIHALLTHDTIKAAGESMGWSKQRAMAAYKRAIRARPELLALRPIARRHVSDEQLAAPPKRT